MARTASHQRSDETLRRQRDQFIGFAFAGGDLLLETDLSGRIGYVAGAAHTITGRSEDQLYGRSLPDLVLPGLAADARRFLADLARQGRVAPCRIGFEGVGGRWVLMSGYRREGGSDVLQLSLRFAAEDSAEHPPLPGPDLFKDQLLERLQRPDCTSTLTLLDLSELDGWSADAAASCRREIGKCVQGLSAEDSAAGWLADDVLGIMQDAELDVAILEESVKTHSKIADPKGIGLIPKIAALPLGHDGLKPGDAAQALLYAINRFVETKGKDFTIASLQDGFDRMVEETVQRVVQVRDTVNNDDIELTFQPIVAFKTRMVHHHEVLSRLKNGRSPFELVCFAEQVGLIAEFDLMVCRRVMSMLDRQDRMTVPLAINLSARSMESEAFSRALLSLLAKFPDTRGRVMFELTESAAISQPDPVAALIKTLRKKKIPVCLDDFGSGAAAFHYLRAFQFDYVKIDGMYVQSTSQRDQAILRGMTALCKELGVKSVAEMVETKIQAERLARLGIDLGQGYLFGRPRPDIG